MTMEKELAIRKKKQNQEVPRRGREKKKKGEPHQKLG